MSIMATRFVPDEAGIVPSIRFSPRLRERRKIVAISDPAFR
jgi:hypothetical protein